MPTKRRPGVRQLYTEIPDALAELLDALSQRNRRTLTAEVIIALERHLAAEGIDVPTIPAKKRGRPPKATNAVGVKDAEQSKRPRGRPRQGR